MPRVLFVAHASGAGGAENHLGMVLEGLDRQRYRPTVAMRRRPWFFSRPRGLETRCRQLGVDARFVELKWWVRDWRHDAAFAHDLPARVAQLAKLIDRLEIDLVFTFTSAVVEGALAARACGVPHIWQVLEMLDRDPVLHPFLPLEAFFGLVQRLSHRIVTVSQSVRAIIEHYAPTAQVDVIHTGLPPVKLRPDRPGKRELFGVDDTVPVVAFVGLLSQRKGPLDFVEAARRIVAKRPNVRFFLAGRDGGERRRVDERIAEYGLERHVAVLGPRNDVPELLSASDLLVLPALADPLPLAVLEAMSLGLPVVATRSGGCEEMVVDGVTGRLVPVAAPDALAGAIESLLADETGRREMGRRGLERKNAHFTHEAYINTFSRLLDETVQTSPPAGTGGSGKGVGCLLCEAHEGPFRQKVPDPFSLADTSFVAKTIAELQAAARQRRADEWRTASLRERLYERALTRAYRLQMIH